MPSAFPATPEDLLAVLLACPSVNPDHGGAPEGQANLLRRLEEIAAAAGLRTRRLPVPEGGDNLLVHAEEIPGAEWLLFESHLDTVSTEGMTVPPFTLTRQGDRLHGRGACDTKGSGAAMLWALWKWSTTSPRRRNAGVVFTLDEEARMLGAQAFAQQLRAFAPLRGIVVGEPTGLRPIVAHNGALRWRTVTRGIAAHSADPGKGRSAIAAMLPVIAALEARFIPLANRDFPLTGRAAASINVIRGGSAVNVVPDHCEILCDRRLVPGEDAALVLAQRDAALAGLDCSHDGVYLAPALPPGSSAELHAWMRPAFAAVGLEATAGGAPYATNASHYAAAGAPVLVLGPGDLAQAHTKDEWLDRRELARAISLYSALLDLPA